MRNLSFNGKLYGVNLNIVQIQKRTAKKFFDSGETIYLQSSNFHPFGFWSTCVECNKININSNDPFENIVSSFEYYNCINKETGLYTTFYKSL